MAHRWALSPDLADRIAALASDLSAAFEEHQAEWDQKTEAWQDGERGTEIGAWIEAIGELADTLEAFEVKP